MPPPPIQDMLTKVDRGNTTITYSKSYDNCGGMVLLDLDTFSDMVENTVGQNVETKRMIRIHVRTNP
jgi:hypothetical protein